MKDAGRAACRRARASEDAASRRLPGLSARSAGRAPAARAARCARAARGRPDRDGLGDAPRDARSAGRARHATTSSSRARERALQARLEPRALEVVQEVLGLVLKAQHADRGADLHVGERHARQTARRRRSDVRADRSWRRRSRPACAPRAPATSRAPVARPPRAPRPRECRGRRSGSARSGGGGERSGSACSAPLSVNAMICRRLA